MEKHRKKRIIQGIAGVCVLVVTVLVITGLWLYSGSARGARFTVLSMVGAPLGVVGSEYITPEDVRYYTQVGQDGLSAGVPVLVRVLQIVSVAHARGIHITEAHMQRVVAELQVGDEQYKNFEARYGERAAFQVLAVPYAYTNALRMDYLKQGVDSALTQQLQNLSVSLRSDEDWKAAAAAVSDDPASSWAGGDVGYVDLHLAIPEYAEAVQGLPLQDSAVIYTRYGAHIVEVLRRVSKEGREFTQLREIVLRPKHFETWLAEQTAGVSVQWYVSVPASIETKN